MATAPAPVPLLKETRSGHFWVPARCLVIGIKRNDLGLICKSEMGKKGGAVAG